MTLKGKQIVILALKALPVEHDKYSELNEDT